MFAIYHVLECLTLVLDHPADQLPGSSQNSRPHAVETARRGRGCGCTDIVMAVSVLSAHLHMADRVAKVLQMFGDVTLARQELPRETQ